MTCSDKSLEIDKRGAGANEYGKRRNTSPIPLQGRRYIRAREDWKGGSPTVTLTVKGESRAPSHMGSSYFLIQ